MAYLGTKPANQVIDSTLIADGTITPADLSTGKPVWDTSGNLGVGTSSPAQKLHVASAGTTAIQVQNTASTGAAYLKSTNTATTCTFGVDSSGGYVETIGAYNTIFYTNGAERIRIDSSGRVTMPYQPAFSVIKSGNQYPVASTNTRIENWTERFDVGSNFNASTGRFTAPVSGKYYFIISVMLAKGGNGDYQVKFFKNGSQYVVSNDMVSNTAATYLQTTVPALIELAVNDYVETFFFNSADTASFIYTDQYTHLHGYLIG